MLSHCVVGVVSVGVGHGVAFVAKKMVKNW